MSIQNCTDLFNSSKKVDKLSVINTKIQQKKHKSPPIFYRKPEKHRLKEHRFNSNIDQQIYFLSPQKPLRTMLTRSRSTNFLRNSHQSPDYFHQDYEKNNGQYTNQPSTYLMNERLDQKRRIMKLQQIQKEIRYLRDRNQRLVQQNKFCISQIEYLNILLIQKDQQLSKFSSILKLKEQSLFDTERKISQKDKIIHQLEETFSTSYVHSEKQSLFTLYPLETKDNEKLSPIKLPDVLTNEKNCPTRKESRGNIYSKQFSRYEEQTKQRKKNKATNQIIMKEVEKFPKDVIHLLNQISLG